MLKNRPFESEMLDGTSPFFNDTHKEWREQLRRYLAAEIIPNIEAWESAGEVPLEAHKKASEFGLIRLGYPEEYGGVGMRLLEAAHSTEQHPELRLTWLQQPL